MADPNCIFCKILDGRIPATFVHQDEDVVAFQDISPQAPVHLILVPREHFEGLNDLTPERAPLVGKIALVAGKLAKERGCASTGWRLVSNCGDDAGQTVHHLHFHLLGGRPMAGKMV
jgi:histidine triad (HIT) family protein